MYYHNLAEVSLVRSLVEMNTDYLANVVHPNICDVCTLFYCRLFNFDVLQHNSICCIILLNVELTIIV